jgi:sigma-B regulation protein RsbU (phosphoserine phosphatase)
MARAFAVLLALYIVLEWTNRASGLATLLAIVLVVLGSILAFGLIRRVVRKSIWRLRNRLIMTYVFIGMVPIVLILALAGIGTYILVGQVAAYLVSSELDRRAASLQDPVRILSQAREADQDGMAQAMGNFLGQRMPGLQVLVTGAHTVHYPHGSALEAPAEVIGDYTGCIRKGNVFYFASIRHGDTTTVIAAAPITPKVLAQIVPGIGALTIGERAPVAGTVPAAYNGLGFLDFSDTWFDPIQVARWDHPQKIDNAALWVTTRPSAVLGAIFGNGISSSNGIDSAELAVIFFSVVAGLLLAVEMVSLVIGVSLSRSITGAVHGLYEGTLQIAKGDFGWRIPVKGSDQLADLSRSFNNMAGQIENLVVVAKEKERLQSEVEIASDVQNQLFPHAAPTLRTIELIGICQPARMVSGDYYDYLCLPDGNLALAIGDVAGKGISAALLMASIQSIMRTQIAAGLPLLAAAVNGQTSSCFSTSNTVAQLNRQLYASTAPEKYATFFFGVYDETSRMLTYTNAGHLPPLLLRRGEVTLLDVTGTVVGAFPAIRYEEQKLEIQPDDLLIAYTDGITEPENAYGEEFGTERLAEIAQRHYRSEPREIVAKIMEAVRHWSTAPELPDDMTVVIARGRR